MKYIGISNWVSDCARKNYFIREQDVRTVLYSVEREIYRPLSRVYSRDLFGMNSDEYVVLFGANTLKNKRKGFDLLLEALEALPETINGKPVRAFLFGPRLAFDYKGKVPIEHAGYISDARMLAILYNAVDVMVTPSRQEAFGMTCLEALACGTPVVAFAIGGFLIKSRMAKTVFWPTQNLRPHWPKNWSLSYPMMGKGSRWERERSKWLAASLEKSVRLKSIWSSTERCLKKTVHGRLGFISLENFEAKSCLFMAAGNLVS